MNKRHVLDHGFVLLLNVAGPTRRHNLDFDADDIDPANAARMSFSAMDKDRTREEDLRLCKYLMKNWHTSPFEMITVWIEMKLPIFVARQFVRHRTVSINEVSGRYVTLPAEWYIPEHVGAAPPPGGAKQGQVQGLNFSIADQFQRKLNWNCQLSYDDYLWAIANQVAPEHARLLLHLNHYTHWLWKQDLHNLMHFLRLRDHPHAQIEAQHYAGAIKDMLEEVLPESMKLFDEYRKMS